MKPITTTLLVLLLVPMSGCNLLTLPFVAAGRAMGDQPPPVYDLGEKTAWVMVDADEREVGTEAAVASDPVAVEARRFIDKHGKKTKLAPSAGAADVVIIAELAVPKEDEVLGTLSTGAALAFVRVLQDDQEIWPSDGTRGHRVEVSVDANAFGTASETRRTSFKLLGQKVARLFVNQNL